MKRATQPWWRGVESCPSILRAYSHEFDGPALHAMLCRAFRGDMLREQTWEGSLAGEGGLEGLLRKLKELGGRLVLHRGQCDETDASQILLVVWPGAYVTLDLRNRRVVMHAAGLRASPIEALCSLGDAWVPALGGGGGGQIYVLGHTDAGLQLMDAGDASAPFEAGNYTEAAVAAFGHIAEDLVAASPCGRLVVLEGLPGTGKTRFVRDLIEAARGATFVTVPARMIARLAEPELIPMLLWRCQSGAVPTAPPRPMVFVLEDADSALSTRMVDNIDALSTLLGLADGLLTALPLRIIATTNARKIDMDPALLRRGRICRRVEIEPLAPSHALAVYRRLLPDAGPDALAALGRECAVAGSLPLASVYGLARDAGWSPAEASS